MNGGRPDWKVRFAFYGDKNKEALAMASIGWKKRAELIVCRMGSSYNSKICFVFPQDFICPRSIFLSKVKLFSPNIVYSSLFYSRIGSRIWNDQKGCGTILGLMPLLVNPLH